MPTPTPEMVDAGFARVIEANLDRRKDLVAEIRAIDETAKDRQYTSREQRRVNEIRNEIEACDERVANLVRDAKRDEDMARAWNNGGLGGLSAALDDGGGGGWAERAASVLRRDIESRGLFSAPFTVPQVVAAPVPLPTAPRRILDLVSRDTLDQATYEYLRQTVRTNNAEAVADAGTKPTSVNTLTPIVDRPRVVAHLSEKFPQRYLDDHRDVVDFLRREMESGVLAEIERLIVAGDPNGFNPEEWAGILETAGVVPIAPQVDVWTTLRRARTVLDSSGVVPTAWAFSPTDAELFDLSREETDGSFLLGSGINNVFGDLPRVVSPSIPQGTAVLADWSMSRLWTRQDITLEATNQGDLFDKNEVKLRAEGRYGFGLLQPSAFAVIDLATAEES